MLIEKLFLGIVILFGSVFAILICIKWVSICFIRRRNSRIRLIRRNINNISSISVVKVSRQRSQPSTGLQNKGFIGFDQTVDQSSSRVNVPSVSIVGSQNTFEEKPPNYEDTQ